MAWENITIGDIVSETDLLQHNLNIYKNTLAGAPTGNTSADGSPEYKIYAIKNSKGSLDVAIQDQTTDRISLFLAQILGLIESMTGTGKDVDTFNVVTDGVVPAVGNYLCLQEDGKITQEEITVVTLVSGNEYTITIAVPLDYDYTTDGSCSTELAFMVGPKGNFSWDINRIMVAMVLATAGDDGLFGNIAALTTNQYFRKEDSGNSQNLFTVRENADFALEGYDVAYTIRSSGGGEFGMRSRITFNGQDKSGVTIRLDGATNDTFKTVIRDQDLTDINKYRIKVQGHVVE
jgi:hypothetical protein